MKSFGRLAALFIIPAVLFFTVYKLRDAWGAHYFTHNADPAYLYLINSLNVATLYPVQHVDNPGTTVQILGGIVIRVIAFFKDIRDIEKDVFSRPEYYLTAINRALLSINLIALVILGCFALRITGSIAAALLLQCAPFGSYLMVKSMLMVSPEPMSVLAGTLVIILAVWASERRAYEKHTGLFAVASAAVVAFGLATKLTYLPIILMPLIIINGIKWRAIYILLTAVFFHVIIAPAYSHYDFLIHWVKILFLHADNYGQGAMEIVSIGNAAVSFVKLIALEHPFFIVLFLSLLLLALIFFDKDIKHKLWKEPPVRVLFALTIAMLFHVLLVAKHYNPRYMIPSLMLLTTLLHLNMIVYSKLKDMRQFNFIRAPSFRVGAITALTVLFLTRHFMGYLPGDTVVVWQQAIESRASFSDWIPKAMFENFLLFAFLAMLLFVAASMLTGKTGKSIRAPLTGIMIMVILYHFRHVDIGGFYHRCAENKQEALAIINTVDNKYRDYIKIFAGRSSSQLYALKYGTSTNFTRASQLARLKELYPGNNIYFWRLKWGDLSFESWTEKVTLQEIRQKGIPVIIQGDMSSLNAESVEKMERENNVKLEPGYQGKTEIVYMIKDSEKGISARR